MPQAMRIGIVVNNMMAKLSAFAVSGTILEEENLLKFLLQVCKPDNGEINNVKRFAFLR